MKISVDKSGTTGYNNIRRRLERSGIVILEKNKNPNLSSIEKMSGFSFFGADEGI